MQYLTLNNGVQMPLAGFGTFMLGREICKNAVRNSPFPLQHGPMTTRSPKRSLLPSKKRRRTAGEYTSEQSYRKSVAQYVQFYNEMRPHRTLKYKTSQAFEEAYWASLS